METALHYASKLLAFLWNPLGWIVMLLAVVCLLLIRGGPRALGWARPLAVLTLFLVVFLGWQYPSNALLRELEDRYPALTGDLSRFEGIVVLGGSTRGSDGRDHGQIAFNGASERMLVAVPIMRQYPAMKLLFTGGDASIVASRGVEADMAEEFFRQMQVDLRRVRFERASRNTFENARFTASLIGEEKTKPWLLVTSAAHMPRAMAAFSAEGWNVTAYPVDYQSDRRDFFLAYSLDEGLAAWAQWLRESIGLLVYRALGRSG